MVLVKKYSNLNVFSHKTSKCACFFVIKQQNWHVSSQKIKKEETTKTISLVPTKDTLAELGKLKKTNQVLIGFALETQHEVENAKVKLKKKNTKRTSKSS